MTKVTYDIKKIIGDKNYALENHFKVKQSNDLYIIKYNKQLINNENISSYGKFRSIITDGNTIIAMAPPKSYNFEHFKKLNSINDCIIQEFVEGTMINCFYYNNKWIISTRSVIGADCSFYGKTFLKMFNEALDKINFKLDLLDPAFSYSFVLQHPENKIVVQFDEPIIVLVEIYYRSESKMIPKNIYSDSFNHLEKYFKFPAIYSEKDISLKNWDEILKRFNECHYTTLGCIIKNMNTGERTKIRNQNYEFVRKLKGNISKKQFLYYNLRKDHKINEFLRFFPEYNDDFLKMQKQLHDWTETLYKNYRNCFVKKEKGLKEYPFPFRIHMYNLHKYYLSNLKKNRFYIDKRKVINHVNGLDPPALMFLINHPDLN